MQSKLWILAAALAAVQGASAVPERPRIYFPRHVKRQFHNATITQSETFPPPDTASSTSPTTLTTKRDPEPQIPDGTGSGGVTTVYVATETTVVTPSSFPVPSTNPGVVISSVGPAVQATPSSGLPPIIVLPTISSLIPDIPLLPTDSSSTSSGILLAPTGPVTPTSSSAVESQTTIKPSSPTVSVAPSAAPTGSPSSKPVVQSSATSTIVPVVVVTSSTPLKSATSAAPVTSAPTSSKPVSTPSAEPNPLTPLISIISSILPLPSTPVNATSSAVPQTSKAPVVSLPLPVPTSSSPAVVTSAPPASTIVPTTSVPPPPPPTSVPPPPASNTTTEVPPTSTLPVVSSQPPVSHNETVTSTGSPISTPPPVSTGGNSGISITPNSTSSSHSAIVTPGPTTTGPGFTSVPATGTITDSESWLPTTMLVQVSSIASQPTQVLAPTTTASLPSNLPQVISPNDPGSVTKPEDSVLAQVGFLQGLNYDFVSKTPKAAAQIFSYLPVALGYSTGLDTSKIVMTQLVPLDTSRSLGYFTTLARFYIQRSVIDTLRVDIKVPYSDFYTNPDLIVYNLTQQVNPAIEILPDDSSSTGSAAAGSTSNPAGDPFGGSTSSQSPQQIGTTAGIAFGAFGVALAYGAAMFIVARRYKRKKQAHQRSSSISHGTGSSGMRYTGSGSPALMGGALLSRDFSAYGGVPGGRESHGSGRSGAGNSARTAIISAPVAAENSLGWN